MARLNIANEPEQNRAHEGDFLGIFAHRLERLRLQLGDDAPLVLDDTEHGLAERWIILLRNFGFNVFSLFLITCIFAFLFFSTVEKDTLQDKPEALLFMRDQGAYQPQEASRKSDRLYHPIDFQTAKKTVSLMTSIKSGQREILIPRKFTRIAANLILFPNEFADSVPVFNANKILANNVEPAEAVPAFDPLAQDDAEVSMMVSPLPTDTGAEQKTHLSTGDARAQVDEILKQMTFPDLFEDNFASALQSSEAVAALSQKRLMSSIDLLATRSFRFQFARTNAATALITQLADMNQSQSRLANLDVRLIPENISTAIKSRQQKKNIEERVIGVHKGDTLDSILRLNGASPDRIASIYNALNMRRTDAAVQEGNEIHLLMSMPALDNAVPSFSSTQIMRVVIYDHERTMAKIALSDAGKAVSLAVAADTQNPPARNEGEEEESGGFSLYESFYETCLKQGLSKSLIDELIANFASDVDFQSSVSDGDRTELFLSEADDTNPTPEILFASMSVHGQTYRYFRYQASDDQTIDYYDANGRSARKFLVRKPIVAGELSSTYGMRYHPILHVSRLHSGIDWRAPIGTPIFAAGTGTITEADWDSGYGRHIEIQHANGYTTTYSHMSAFAKGIHAGLTVRQGQVIGYLGRSGLATGPHLHYEVLVNGKYVDPLAIKLARTREFNGKQLADFARERDRINGLMAKVLSNSS